MKLQHKSQWTRGAMAGTAVAVLTITFAAAGQAPARSLMETTRALVWEHAQIERSVEAIEGGVRTVTVSEDPEVAALLRKHVHGMKEHLEAGGRVRM